MIRKLIKRLLLLFWCLPGFLLWASFPPMGEKTDCLFALAPLLWLARKRDSKTNAKIWFVNGFLFWFATLSWMPAIAKNGGPLPLVFLGWGALAIYCALYFGASGFVISKFWIWTKKFDYTKKSFYFLRLFGLLIVEPIIWVGFEIIRSRFAGGFAWNQLGVAPINAGFGAPAVFGGVYLVSALVILINGTIASIVERMWRSENLNVPTWVRSFETIVPILLILGIFSSANNYIKSSKPQSTREVRVGLVQRNFPCVFKREAFENPFIVYSNLLQNVKYLKPDMLVMAESAFAEIGDLNTARARSFASWLIDEAGAKYVLAGGSRNSLNDSYNSAGLYASDHSLSIYDKVHLVPFGEYIPGYKIIPALEKLAPVGTCTPGEVKLLTHDDLKIGVAICFEDTDSAHLRKMAEKGANILALITNDSWFSYSREAEQHSWQSVARAIETGLPIVRVGNSGVTGTILSDGKATWLKDENGDFIVDQAATLFDRVKVSIRPQDLTPYVKLGDKPLFFAFLILITAMGVVKYKDNRKYKYEKRR